MNWINSIRLENFQSHLDTEIDLTKGLNVIVGQSDSGKTAILRGLRWALFNQPRGSDFLRVGADFVRVTVQFSSGKSIVRERTSSKNRYIIKEAEKEDFILEGFGVHVPQEILDVHQLKPLRIERDQELLLHLGQQLDGPFLLEQTPALRAKTIGRISGAHYLDMAVRDTSSDISKLKQHMKHSEEEIEKLKEKLTPFAFLDDAKQKLDTAYAKASSLKTMQSKLESLKKRKEILAQNEMEKEQIAKQWAIVENHDKWEQALLKLEKMNSDYHIFRRRKQHLSEVEQQIAICKIWLEKTKHYQEAKQTITMVEKQLLLYQKLVYLREQKIEINEIEKQATTTMQKTIFATKEKEQQVKELEGSYEKIKQLYSRKMHFYQIKDQMEKVQRLLGKLVAMKGAEELTAQLETKQAEIIKLRTVQEKWLEINKRIQDGAVFLQDKQKQEEELRHLYEHALLERGTCPTCGSKVEEEAINTIFTR